MVHNSEASSNFAARKAKCQCIADCRKHTRMKDKWLCFWFLLPCVYFHFIEINRTHKKNKNIFGKATGYAEKATKWGKSSRNGTQLNPCYMREKSAIAVKMHGNSLRLCSHVFISFPYSGIAVGMIENICKKYREFAPSLNSWSNTVE